MLASKIADIPFRMSAASAPVLSAPDWKSDWVTEAVLGEPAIVIGECGDWAKIALPLQESELDNRGYPGWVLRSSIVRSAARIAWQTTAHRTPLLDMAGEVLQVLPMGACLEAADSSGGSNLEGKEAVRTCSGQFGLVESKHVTRWPPAHLGRACLLDSLAIWSDQPYIWGGTSSLTGSDCSGLVYRTYQRIGILLPRDAHEQFREAPNKTEGPLDGALPGDLVFFQKPSSQKISHVGIYVGDGLYISAKGSARGICTHEIERDAYFGWARYLTDA